MLAKAGDGRSGSHLKTVQLVNDPAQFQEQDQEEETLLGQYQTLSRWIAQSYRSGNLWEEEMSRAQYKLLRVTRSTVS